MKSSKVSQIEDILAEKNYMVTSYKCATDYNVSEIIDLQDIIKRIKNGDNNLNAIKEARSFQKNTPPYDMIKTSLLPTFRFNFLFDGYATTKNIKQPTGLLYIDADGVDSIPQSNYILAMWKSLSNTGFGILVKVENLTVSNMHQAYVQLENLLNIKSDKYSKKANQQTVLSYDPNIYYNSLSECYHIVEAEMVSTVAISKKKKEGITTDDTFLIKNFDRIMFDNIWQYFVEPEYRNVPYRVFKEKVSICSVFIRDRYHEGDRNNTMFIILSQLALLNPLKNNDFLTAMAYSINKKMYPRLSSLEIESIVASVARKRDENSLQLNYNKERTILYNPNIIIPRKSKVILRNKEIGKLTKERNMTKIKMTIKNWNLQKEGKLTQNKVSIKSGLSLSTIKRCWAEARLKL